MRMTRLYFGFLTNRPQTRMKTANAFMADPLRTIFLFLSIFQKIELILIQNLVRAMF